MLRKEERVTYLQAIWATFQGKAKTQRAMTPREYYVAAKWADKNIPLPVVIRGIEEFNGKPSRLEAVERSVDKAHAYWFQAMGGL